MAVFTHIMSGKVCRPLSLSNRLAKGCSASRSFTLRENPRHELSVFSLASDLSFDLTRVDKNKMHCFEV